jgi:hypothetical protein
MLLDSIIKGKPVTSFPVYLQNAEKPEDVIVVNSLNDVMSVAKTGTWVNLGIAPKDRNRAILSSKPESKITISKTFEIHRIIGRDKNTFHLYPENTFEPSVFWISGNRPIVGGYLIRHGDDYYTAVSEKTFESQYGKSLTPALRKELKDSIKNKHLGSKVESPSGQVGENDKVLATVDTTDKALMGLSVFDSHDVSSKPENESGKIDTECPVRYDPMVPVKVFQPVGAPVENTAFRNGFYNSGVAKE